MVLQYHIVTVEGMVPMIWNVQNSSKQCKLVDSYRHRAEKNSKLVLQLGILSY